MVTGDPETTLDDLIDDPDREDLGQSSDAELLRRVAREVAIGTIVLAEEIMRRAALPGTDLVALAPALRSIAACLDAVPNAFQQVLALKMVRECPSYEASLCADTFGVNQRIRNAAPE